MENDKIINFLELKFLNRFASSLLNWGTAYFLLSIILGGFYIHYWVSIISALWLAYDVYKTYVESSIYITSISIEEGVINIHFFNKNFKQKAIISSSKLKVDWYQSVKGVRTPSNLKIYNGNELKLVQYGIGKWTRIEIERVGNILKKHEGI